MISRIRRCASALLLALLLASLGGCRIDESDATDAGPAPSRPEDSEPSSPDGSAETVSVWLVDANGAVVAVPRRVAPTAEGSDVASLEALLDGTTPRESSDGLSTAIPEGSRLLGLTIDGGIATVNLSAEYETGAGAASVIARLAQVVCTVDDLPAVDGVRIALEGRLVDVFSGEGIVLSEPVSCADYSDLHPA